MFPLAKLKENTCGSKVALRNAIVTGILNNLPPELARTRILPTHASAAFWGVSEPHWRRLYRAGKVPQPIKIGDRKLGWHVGDLADALAVRETVDAQ
jgi:predicted DNA-binding transcriptional regulator AlpA